MPRGKLITVEGLDGAGKTTLVSALAQQLGAHGRTVFVMREPGGVDLSERIRALVKDPAIVMGRRAEALLYAAARAQLVDEQLEPLLVAGSWVVLDRFVDSSLAYQGAGRGLGIAPIGTLNAFATGGLIPDKTLLLQVDPATGRERISSRRQDTDRLEREQESFFTAVAEAYAAIAEAEPERVTIIDASQPPDQVLADALAAVAHL